MEISTKTLAVPKINAPKIIDIRGEVYISKKDFEKLKNKFKLNNISILVRAIFQTREFEERFLQVGIGYRVLGGIKFYERAEIKDAVAYLRIVNQKFDDLALERVIGSPKRGVGESSLNQIYSFGKANKLCLEDSIIKIIES